MKPLYGRSYAPANIRFGENMLKTFWSRFEDEKLLHKNM